MGSIRRDEGGNPPRLFDFIRRDEEGRPSPSRLFDFIQHDEEGRPSSLCLFDFIRHDEEGRPSPSCPFDVLQCDKAPNTRSVPIWAYSWCSCPLHLSRHVKCAQTGMFYMSGVVYNTKHQKHTCLGVFSCSTSSPSEGWLRPLPPPSPSVNTPPLPYSTREMEGAFLIKQ